MSPELAMWLNRAGLLLDFLALWFAAPEILGEERLRSLGRVSEDVLRSLLSVAQTFLGAEITPGCAGYLEIVVLYLIGQAVLIWLAFEFKRWLRWWWRLGTFLTFLFGMLAAIALLPRLLARLAEDPRMRHRSLMLGALMFMLGFALQFTATF